MMKTNSEKKNIFFFFKILIIKIEYLPSETGIIDLTMLVNK